MLVQIPSNAVSMNGGSIQYTIPKTTTTKTTPYIISTSQPTVAATQTTTKMAVQTITSDVFDSIIEADSSKVMMAEEVASSDNQIVLDSEEDATLTDDLDETKFLVPKTDAKDGGFKKKYITQIKPIKPEYPFVCSCGKSYKIKGSLKRHQSYECGVIPSLTCKYCPHKSKYKSDLRKHILQKHAHLDPDLNSTI